MDDNSARLEQLTESLKPFFIQKGAPPEQARVMARQLVRKAFQNSSAMGKNEVDCLRELLEKIEKADH